MFRRFSSALVALSFVALAAVSCSKTQQTSETTPPESTAQATITDPDIIAIFVAANDADIKNGEQAKSKARSQRVKDFADRMIQDHTAAKNDATHLADQLSMQAQENETSRSLVSQNDAMRDSLGKLTGADYDKAYVDNEVAVHEVVLNALDHTLIPNAQNAELKALLERVRPTIQSHLEHAKTLQSASASK
jgi:putative membrane protein